MSERSSGRARHRAIRVAKDGIWYFHGREIIRKEIVRFFCENLHLDEREYYVEVGAEREYLDVEDTVFLVVGAELVHERRASFVIHLNDGTREQLDLSTFWINEQNVPYCTVKGGAFPARFLRLPYYQVAQYADYDEEKEEYFVMLDGQRFPLRVVT